MKRNYPNTIANPRRLPPPSYSMQQYMQGVGGTLEPKITETGREDILTPSPKLQPPQSDYDMNPHFNESINQFRYHQQQRNIPHHKQKTDTHRRPQDTGIISEAGSQSIPVEPMFGSNDYAADGGGQVITMPPIIVNDDLPKPALGGVKAFAPD